MSSRTFVIPIRVTCSEYECAARDSGQVRFCRYSGGSRCTLFDELLTLGPQGPRRCGGCLEAERQAAIQKEIL